MAELSYKLNDFEGPLDLLLHLIAKHKLNILDIKISLLVEQYLLFMDNLDAQDMESAGEFLEMAARLIYIKTVSLLPSYEEAIALKKELEGRLIEYSLCKKAAQILREKFAGDEIFTRKPMKIPVDKTYNVLHQVDELVYIYDSLSTKIQEKQPISVTEFKPLVAKKIYSVTAKIIYVLKTLYSGKAFDMDKLYIGMTVKSERIATFLAVLELTKSGRIFFSDDDKMLNFSRNRNS